MINISITNIDVLDKMVDLKGENKVEDKVIIHPKTTVRASVSDPVLNTIKLIPKLIIKRV